MVSGRDLRIHRQDWPISAHAISGFEDGAHRADDSACLGRGDAKLSFTAQVLTFGVRDPRNRRRSRARFWPCAELPMKWRFLAGFRPDRARRLRASHRRFGAVRRGLRNDRRAIVREPVNSAFAANRDRMVCESHASHARFELHSVQRRCAHHFESCAVLEAQETRLESLCAVAKGRVRRCAEIRLIKIYAALDVLGPQSDVFDSHAKAFSSMSFIFHSVNTRTLQPLRCR